MFGSLIWYLRQFCRRDWIRSFLFVMTAPLRTPPHFRNFPLLTGKECTHQLACMMICPAPGAIEVVKGKEEEDGGWTPVIHEGHCIRCGLCVEACPEGVLMSGRILESMFYDNTAFSSTFHLMVDHDLCMRCGNCSVACPVNKVEDPALAAGGHASNDESIMLVREGKLTILHEEKCTGCKTCEESCPNGAIRVARLLEGICEEEVVE